MSSVIVWIIGVLPCDLLPTNGTNWRLLIECVAELSDELH